MKRRDFIATGSLGVLGLSLSDIAVAESADNKPADSRKKILISGGGLNKSFLSYLVKLTGKKNRVCVSFPQQLPMTPGWRYTGINYVQILTLYPMYRTCSLQVTI